MGLFTLSLKSNHRTTHLNTLYRILPHSRLRTLTARTAKPPPSSPPLVQQSSDNLILPHSLPHSPSHTVGLAFCCRHHHCQQHNHCGLLPSLIIVFSFSWYNSPFFCDFFFIKLIYFCLFFNMKFQTLLEITFVGFF